jgi:predicted N-formylglutamate amidohydrolase
MNAETIKSMIRAHKSPSEIEAALKGASKDEVILTAWGWTPSYTGRSKPQAIRLIMAEVARLADNLKRIEAGTF